MLKGFDAKALIYIFLMYVHNALVFYLRRATTGELNEHFYSSMRQDVMKKPSVVGIYRATTGEMNKHFYSSMQQDVMKKPSVLGIYRLSCFCFLLNILRDIFSSIWNCYSLLSCTLVCFSI